MLQTPPASSKKSASAAAVKPVVAASPNKKKLANPFAAVHAAPGESSDTTDISENEGNPPAVVSFNVSGICFILLTNNPRRHQSKLTLVKQQKSTLDSQI